MTIKNLYPASRPSLDLNFAKLKRLDPRITFSRASSATYVDADGLIKSATAGQARFDHSPTTGESLGLLVEEARTNLLLHNRTLTDAAWVTSNVTAAKDQVGVDGVASSASKITASGANGTILQTITSASAARATSAYVKRITGTGAIEMTQDNGTTWTAITVTNAWTRVAIPSATVTNPVVGFRIVVNNDAIAVDYVQCESGTFIGSAIETTSATVTRSADVAQITGANFSSWYNQDASTIYSEARFVGATIAGQYGSVWSFANGTGFNNFLLGRFQDGVGFNAWDENDAVAITYSESMASGPSYKTAASYSQAGTVINKSLALNGFVRADAPSSVTYNAHNTFNIGKSRNNVFPLVGTISRLTYWPTRLSDATLQALTAS
jgi:hypothetical protein